MIGSGRRGQTSMSAAKPESMLRFVKVGAPDSAPPLLRSAVFSGDSGKVRCTGRERPFPDRGPDLFRQAGPTAKAKAGGPMIACVASGKVGAVNQEES